MPMLDLYDQITVTEFVRRNYEAVTRSAAAEGGEDRNTNLGRKVLPMVPHRGRHVRIRYADITGVGLAPFKAPGAAPMLWTRKPNLREQFMEMQDIDEAHPVDPVEMLAIKSNDPNRRDEAQFTLAENATAMAERNDNRTEWMRWEALKGILPVNLPNAGSISINYGIPAGHFPTFATAWTDLVNSDPIEDLWALGAVAIPNAGIYLDRHHMSFKTHRLMLRNQKLNAKLSSYGRDVMFPKESDVTELLRDGTTIVKTDDGWMTEGSATFSLNRWIAEGKIFTTTSNYRYLGRPIGEVKDGWVLVGSPGADQPVARQGMQSEWIYDRVNQHTLFRQASARMVVLYAPQAIAWGTAHA
jgi:hypothetical protein